MRQINCYIPIKLRIVGELSDAQFDQLGETLVRIIAGRIAFAQRTLTGQGMIPQVGAWGSIGPIEFFEPARWESETETYTIPSYKDGGTPTAVRTASKRKKRRQIAITNEIRQAVEEKLLEQPLDLGFIADPAMIAAWRVQLVLWTYSNFFVPEKPPKESELRKIQAEIEKKIVIPLMGERLRAFYESVGAPYHVLSLAPEVEYAVLPKDVRDVVAGGLSGWLQIRDEIAAHFTPELQSNLLRFYGMAPEGKMVKVKVWQDREPVIVHEDLLVVLEPVASILAHISPLLRDKYPDFWKHHSALGLQIRHIRGSKTLSPHTVGKAIDTSATYNPHLKDPGLLTILSLLGDIDSTAGVRRLQKRRALLASQRETLLAGREMSEEFKRFLLEAEGRYREWLAAQEKFQSIFPRVFPGTDRPVVLREVIQRVEAEHDKVKLRLDKAAEVLEKAEQDQTDLEDERKRLSDHMPSLRTELRQISNQIKQLRRKRQTPQKTKGPSEMLTIADAEKRRTAISLDTNQTRTRLKELNGLLQIAKKTINQAKDKHKKIGEEYKFLGNLAKDLVGDDDLLFKEDVVNPGLETIRRQGYLNIPWEVIRVFLEHGFDWGGLWQAPDFMHFEWSGKVSGEE